MRDDPRRTATIGRGRGGAGRARPELGQELAARVADTFNDYHVLARRDERNIAQLRTELDSRPLLLVPQLDDDVQGVGGLLAVHRYLFASAHEREKQSQT